VELIAKRSRRDFVGFLLHAGCRIQPLGGYGTQTCVSAAGGRAGLPLGLICPARTLVPRSFRIKKSFFSADSSVLVNDYVSVNDLEAVPKKVTVGEKRLQMAQQLIESLSGNFEPENYHDEYTEKVRTLIDRKAQGEEIVTEPQAEEAGGKVIDLMATLEKSLAKAGKKKKAKASEKPAKERKGKSA
jgi:hypothetical protein